MKICALSDTHSYHRKVIIPDADVLIHAGDITWKGELSIFADFSNWLKDLPIRHKIVIFGNHSIGTERGPNRNVIIDMIRGAGAHYLEDSGIEIDGKLFWGSPVSPRYFDWEWNRDRGADIKRHWDKIPDNTNVLITHGSPYNILDDTTSNGHQGCEDLLNRIWELKNLELSVFGHLHKCGQQMEEINGVKFVNAAVLDDAYQLHDQLYAHPIITIDL
jgi:Icc-related predicted phosphoesterase